MAVHSLTMTQTDFFKISALIKNLESTTALLLDEELNRAAIVADESLPENVVAMHSRVRYLDVEAQKESEFTLVFPHEASLDEHKISVLAPIGAALIGLKVGETILWPLPNGKSKEIQVLDLKQSC
jgi:regulator of nucleoside diphosphate kinase